MAKQKKQAIDFAVVEAFSKTAAFYQERSRCECPTESKLHAMVARKYLNYVIDELRG